MRISIPLSTASRTSFGDGVSCFLDHISSILCRTYNYLTHSQKIRHKNISSSNVSASWYHIPVYLSPAYSLQLFLKYFVSIFTCFEVAHTLVQLTRKCLQHVNTNSGPSTVVSFSFRPFLSPEKDTTSAHWTGEWGSGKSFWRGE